MLIPMMMMMMMMLVLVLMLTTTTTTTMTMTMTMINGRRMRVLSAVCFTLKRIGCVDPQDCVSAALDSVAKDRVLFFRLKSLEHLWFSQRWQAWRNLKSVSLGGVSMFNMVSRITEQHQDTPRRVYMAKCSRNESGDPP